MGEVIESLRIPVSVQDVLHGALADNLKAVVVVGETQDGSVVLMTHMDDRPEIMWLLACAKKTVMDAAFVEGDE